MLSSRLNLFFTFDKQEISSTTPAFSRQHHSDIKYFPVQGTTPEAGWKLQFLKD